MATKQTLTTAIFDNTASLERMIMSYESSIRLFLWFVMNETLPLLAFFLGSANELANDSTVRP